MASFDLPALARRQGMRRDVTLRPIAPTQANAQELAALYMPIVRAWEAAIPEIMAGYTPPTLDNLTTDAPADQQAAIDRAAEEVSRLIVAFGAGIERLAVRIERWHRAKWIAGVKAGTEVDLSTILTAQPVQESLEAWIARNVALVTDIGNQAKGRISDAVFRGYQQRTPSRELAREIRKATGMARARAIRVASDQNNKLSAALDMERQAEAGIEQYRWRHSGKAHPRPEHQARNGDVFKLGQPAGDTPGQAPFCGCRAQAYLAIMGEPESD